jgi:chitosanase
MRGCFQKGQAWGWAALFLLAIPAAAEMGSTYSPAGLRDPVKKEIARELISAAENSSLNWRAQCGYIEYNVEGNAEENRGYTGGIVGFTSRTHDLLELVEYYQRIAPGNVLARYLPALRKVDGTPSRKGLGKPFEQAWKKAAKDPKFLRAQKHESDRVYFEPAVRQAVADGLRELGQFIYYDAIVMHGDGSDALSFSRIRAYARRLAKTPKEGGNETTYLHAFLDVRRVAMKAEQGHQNTSRVDTMQRKFLRSRNRSLALPLVFTVNGDPYVIRAPLSAR